MKSKTKHNLHFVVHEHNATHWHHDLRLELNGKLKSWAIPKGLKMNKGDRRLGILVKDHDLKYQFFKGTIPEGEYGAGTVKIWDKGIYRMIDESEDDMKLNDETGKIESSLKRGKLRIEFMGKKLNGIFHIIRLKKKVTG